MKKLMMALAVVAVAACTQAASVTWGSGAFTGPAGEALKNGTSTKNNWGYLFEFASKAVYDTYAADLSKVFTDFKSGDLTATANGKYSAMDTTIALTGKNTYTDGQSVYAAVLYLYFEPGTAGADAVDSATHYIATLATTQAADMGGSITGLATTGGAYTTGWTAVPEPTSGLLMLLGMAGLALKRKRA